MAKTYCGTRNSPREIVGGFLTVKDRRAMDSLEKDDDDVQEKQIVRMERLADRLEKILSKQSEDDDPEAQYEEVIPISSAGGECNFNPTATGDARAALQHLRGLGPFIAQHGSREAKDAFARAVRNLKLAARFDPRNSAYDSRSRRSNEAADFESRVARYHGKAIKLHGEMPTDVHQAQDSDERAESFDQAVERVKRVQQARFAPKLR